MNQTLLVTILFCLFSLSGTSQEWHTDIESAKRLAKESKKPIVLVFQGSDWCAPCIKLDREVWSTSFFRNYAPGNYVMLKADFPRKKKNALSEQQTKTNAVLAEKYNRKGIFPLVVLLNYEGKVLGQTGYKRLSPEAYIKELNRYLNEI